MTSQTAKKEPVQRRLKQANWPTSLTAKPGCSQASAVTVRQLSTWPQWGICCARGRHTPAADERHLTGVEAVKAGSEEDHC